MASKLKKSSSKSAKTSFRRAIVKAKKPTSVKRSGLSAFEREFDKLLAKQLERKQNEKRNTDVVGLRSKRHTKNKKYKRLSGIEKEFDDLLRIELESKPKRKGKRKSVKFRTTRKHIVFTGEGKAVSFPKGHGVEITKRTFTVSRAKKFVEVLSDIKDGKLKTTKKKVNGFVEGNVRENLAAMFKKYGVGIYFLKMHYIFPEIKFDTWWSVPRLKVTDVDTLFDIYDSFIRGISNAIPSYLFEKSTDTWQLKGFEFEFFTEESIQAEAS